MLLEPVRQRLEQIDAAHDAFEARSGGEGDLCGEAGIVGAAIALLSTLERLLPDLGVVGRVLTGVPTSATQW